MADLWLFLSAAGTVLAALAWLRTVLGARAGGRHPMTRLGITSRWQTAFDVDDAELLLDPTIELPERRSMVIVLGDLFDAGERGRRLRATLKAADIDFKPSEAIALLVI